MEHQSAESTRDVTKRFGVGMKPSRISTRTSRSPGTNNTVIRQSTEPGSSRRAVDSSLRTKKETQPNAQMDMYRIMGLGAVKSRVRTDIKKAYRNLALKYHPDKANRNMPA